MGNKPRSSILLNSSVLDSASITSLHVVDLTVSNSLTADGLVLNDNDIPLLLPSSRKTDTLTTDNIITNSIGVILARGNIKNDTVTIDLNSIQQPGNYAQSSIVNFSPSAHIGYISVSLTDNTNLTGSLALYTRGKMLNLTVYTVLFEKNTNSNSSISLNTESGLLTLTTINNVNFEIKALNLIEI